MNINKLIIARVTITILGILFLLNGAFEVYKLFSKTLVNTLSLSLPIYETGNLIYAAIFTIQGYILVHIGIYYKNFFKEITKGIISISIFFISLSFLFITVEDNSESLVNSIQPSIDILLASSIDTIINDNIKILSGEIIDVTISQNSKVQRYNNYNLTSEQAQFFMSQFGISDLTNKKNIYLTRLIITMIYDEIMKTPGLSPDVAIPLNELKSQVKDTKVDLSTLKTIEESIVTKIYPVNINSYLTLLISENDEIKTFTVGQLSENQTNEIWSQLGFNENNSYNTKNKIVDIFLSVVITEIKKANQSELIGAIPLGTIKTMIPSGVIEALNFDILHENYTIRSTEINKLRLSCENKKINITELCDMIMLTKYDHFLTEIENFSEVANIEIPQIYLNNIKEINTINKLETKIIQFTKHKTLFIILGILILLISGISYYIHSKINELHTPTIEIIHKVNKYNLINFTVSFAFLVMGVFLITGEKIFNFIITKVPAEYKSIIETFQTLPIFLEFTNILAQILIYSGIYLLILLIIFLVLHFTIKKTEDIE
jgi:hypothetical protein